MMTIQLTIQVNGQVAQTVEVSSGANRIGSESGCEIRINHPEVSAHAANLQNRGGAMLLQNLNSYPVYVGNEQVAPAAWADWPPGQVLKLTRSVELLLTDSSVQAAAPEQNEDEARRKKARSTVQIAVIAACGVGIVWLLLNDPAQNRVKKLDFEAKSLVEELATRVRISPSGVESDDIEDRVLLHSLQKAWAADMRWGEEDADRAVEAYEIVFHHRKVREAEPGDGDLYGKIRLLAQTRLDELGLRRKSRGR